MESTNISKKPDVQYNEKKFNENLKNDLKSLNVIMLKTILEEKKIEFNPQITDFDELKESAYKNMTRRQKIAVKKKLIDAQKELNEFLKEMKTSSNTKGQNFFEKLGKDVALPATKAAGLAIATAAIYNALMFLPTPVRTITGAAGMSRAVYKGSKAILNQKRNSIGKRYDQIIEKLEIKRNINDEIVDSRFSEKEIEVIKQYFEKYNTQIDTSDYNNLKTTIKNLNNKRKLGLINELNGCRNEKLDINQELRFLKNNEKINYIKSFSAGIAAGAVAGKIFSNKILGPVGTVLGKIPIVSKAVSNIPAGIRSNNRWNNSTCKSRRSNCIWCNKRYLS